MFLDRQFLMKNEGGKAFNIEMNRIDAQWALSDIEWKLTNNPFYHDNV